MLIKTGGWLQKNWAHDINNSVLTNAWKQGDWESGNSHIWSHTNCRPKHSSQSKHRIPALGRKTPEQDSG